MAGSIHFHCPGCDAVRSADPRETTTCAACGHSFMLGDGKTIVRPALPEEIAAARADQPAADPARLAALRTAIDRASAEPVQQQTPAGDEEKVGGWAGAALGFAIAAAAAPVGHWAGEWHEAAGVIATVLLWGWGLATIFAGAREAMGSKVPVAIALAVLGAAIAWSAGDVAMDALGMKTPPAEQPANAAG